MIIELATGILIHYTRIVVQTKMIDLEVIKKLYNYHSNLGCCIETEATRDSQSESRTHISSHSISPLGSESER